MTNAEVKYIMIDQPDDSPFLIRMREQYFQGVQSLSIAQRLLYPMKNAALGYDLVSTFFYASEELPKHWGWPDLHRAYECLRNEVETKRTDPACHEALALGHPGNVQAQASLKGYLCSGLDYQQVGSRCGKSTEVVTIFAHLYCDFLERSESPEFKLGVLDPRCQRGSFATDLAELAAIEDPVLRAMNIGYSFGPDALAQELGEAHDSRTVSELHLLRKIQDHLLLRAERKSLVGSLKSKDPEFISFLKAVAQHEEKRESGPTRNPIEALSGVKAVQSEIDGIFQDQIRDQLQAANGLPAPSAEPDASSPNKA